MPAYKKEINRLVEIEEVQQMIERAPLVHHKVCIALLYLTGARPSELVELKKKDFVATEADLNIQLVTKKQGFQRIIPLDIESTPFVKDLIMPFIDGLPSPDSPLFLFKSPNRIKQIVYKLSGSELCPYNFRHNRLSKLGMVGASAHELMYFKGSKDLSSIAQYLYRSPAVLGGLKKKIR